MKNERNSGRHVPEAHLLIADNGGQADTAGHEEHGNQAQPHGYLVGDHLGAGAESAEQGVLAVGRPAGERDAVDAQRADGEDEEKSDGEVGDDHRHGAMMDEAPKRAQGEIEVDRERSTEGNDGEQKERRNE